MKYDTTLKQLLGRGAPAFLHQVTGSEAVRIDTAEFPATRNRHPDFVAQLADRRLLHMELQGTPDRRMAWRMLEYYGPISESHEGETVVQIVLALTDKAAAAMPTGIKHPTLEFSYAVISIERLDAAPLLESGHVSDTILAVLCRTEDMRGRIRSILERLELLDGNERQDAITQLMVLAGLRKAETIVAEEADAMGVQIDLEQNQVLRGYFDAARATAKAEGKAEGKAELLLRLLDRRFGPVSQTWRDRVLAATPVQLEAWGERLFDAESLEAVLNGNGSA